MADSRPEDAHRLFAEHFNSGDLDALVALYEDGAAFVPQPGEVVTGKEAIREALQGFLATGGKIEVSTRYAVRSGDTALLSGEWRLTGAGQDGEPLDMGGKTAEVVRRQPDGRWLYAVDHPFGAD